MRILGGMTEPASDDFAAKPGDAAIAAGYAVYTPATLRFYDFIVHGVSNRFAWDCPTSKLTAHYQANLSGNHLEAGVGTGLFLDRAGVQGFDRLTLLDANAACLAVAAERLQRYRPELMQASLLDSLQIDSPYDSIGLTYVLHCLPGEMSDKLAVLDTLRPAMHERSVLFGATILGQDVSPNFAARRLLALYNERGVFDNRHDGMAALADGLRRRFGAVNLEQRGLVVLFRAEGPR
jgi:hypothetical protein